MVGRGLRHHQSRPLDSCTGINDGRLPVPTSIAIAISSLAFSPDHWQLKPSPTVGMYWNWLDCHECSKYSILVPPEVTVPRGFAIILGGVPVPPLVISKDFGHEVFRRRQKHVLWLGVKYDADSGYWLALFREEQVAPPNRFDGEHKNMAEHKNLCSKRALASIRDVSKTYLN
jgi:hypothetical protein